MATLVSASPLPDENSNSTYTTVVTSKSLSSLPDAHEYSDYWNEFHEIKSTHPREEEDETPKTPDEVEQEELTWLKEVGYGHLATRYKDGHNFTDEELEMLTATLTHQQARVVKSRVVNLASTWKCRPRLASKTDVRDIFPEKEDEVVNERLRRTESTPVGRGNRRGSKGREPLIKRQLYPILNATSEVADTTDSDIAGLSIHPQSPEDEIPAGSPQALTAISDSDVTLQFVEAEEDKEESNNRLEYSESDKRDALPHFILIKDDWGITRISDLGLPDLERIRSLALIELTALFDSHNIIYSRRKHKKKNKESGVFAVSLEGLVEQDEKFHPGTTVPIFFQQITAHLEKTALSTEGILRIPGSASRLKNLRQSIEEKFPQNAPFPWADVFPNDGAGLLKQFLRELPAPLLTFQYLDAFLQIEKIPEKVQQLKALNLLVLILPTIHRDTLKTLLRFLRKVVKRSSENKMGLNNVAMIIAPNLFLPKSKHIDITNVELNKAAGTSNIVKMLIKYHTILWTVPSFMIMQIRHQIEQENQRKSKDKSKIKFLGRKDKVKDTYSKPSPANETDFQQGVIRVQAPQLTKSSAAIQLDQDMTAGDVVEKFRRHKGDQPVSPMRKTPPASPMSKQGSGSGGKMLSTRTFSNPGDSVFAESGTYLYEVGGNIGERRLDHGANMMAVYKLNPNAEWIIKTKS